MSAALAASTRAFVDATWNRAFLPPPLLTVDQWADQHRKLSTKETGVPGPWRTARVPYLRAIMEALSPASRAELVVFQKGAQIGGSECGLNFLGFTIDMDPSPVMIVFPTIETGRDYSRQRLEEMLRQTPEIRAKVSNRRDPEGGSTQLWKDYPGGMILIRGSNSPSGLRSNPIKKLLLEEVDAYEASAGLEGDPVTLARMRTATFRRRKEFIASTPKRAVTSRVESEFNRCEQAWDFWVACPHCGHRQVLLWERIRYELPASWSLEDTAGELVEVPGVEYECAGCQGRIAEHHKATLLDTGAWEARWNRGPKSIAFHLSALYSPWFSWGRCAAMYERGKQRPEMMQVFVNTILGLPWEEPSEAPDWGRLYARREAYPHGVVPPGVRFLVCGVDHQDDRVEATVVGYGREKRSWVIDHLVLGCSTKLADRTRVLDKLVAREWECSGGGTLPIWCMAVDSGAYTQDVYAWARRHVAPSFLGNRIVVRQPRTVMVCKGYDQWNQSLMAPQFASAAERKRGLKVVGVGVSGLKRELYLWLRLRGATESERAAGIEDPYGYVHFPELEEEWFRQLTAERLIRTRTPQGYDKEQWTQTRPRNEALDCMVLARAASIAAQIDRMTPRDWTRLEATLPPGLLATPAAAPVVELETTGPTASAVPMAPPAQPPPRVVLPPRAVRRSHWMGRFR